MTLWARSCIPSDLWARCIPTDLMGTLYSHRPYGHDAVFPVTLLGALYSHRPHGHLLQVSAHIACTMVSSQRPAKSAEQSPRYRSKHATTPARHSTTQSGVYTQGSLAGRTVAQVLVQARHDTCTAQYNTKRCSHSMLTSRPNS